MLSYFCATGKPPAPVTPSKGGVRLRESQRRLRKQPTQHPRQSPMSNAAPEIPHGTVIGKRYQIEKVLGQGGFGRTYLVFDAYRFSEPCVLKEFVPTGTDGYVLQKSRELFYREATILRKIDHQQIPKLLACFEEDERLFLVQDYVDGKTYSTLLTERLSKGQAFSEAEVIQWLKDLLPVLDYIHRQKIVHRDIAPDNIMLPQNQSKPVLIDFGVVKEIITQIHASSGSMNPNPASLVGKIGYAPREQITIGECFPSSDLYALAVTAAVLLTGKRPNLLRDGYSLEWKWRSYVPVSDSLAQILHKMLADKPQDRYESAREVLDALSGVTPLVERAVSQYLGAAAPDDATAIVSPVKPSPAPAPQAAGLTSLDPAFIERCLQELARCIGPVASFILEDTLTLLPQSSPQQFVEALAAEIPNSQKASEFRQRLLE
jgi:serine/threonine protein kinase